MKDWIDKQLAGGLPAFEGLVLTGEVPLRDEVLNQVIAELLRGGGGKPAPTATQPTPTAKFDPQKLLHFVKRLEVKTSEGAIWLRFDVKV
jgi:hypothetical protein